MRHAGRANNSSFDKLRMRLHHVGHRLDASLFNCLVLCARCHQAKHARRRNARPVLGRMTAGLTLSPPKCATPVSSVIEVSVPPMTLGNMREQGCVGLYQRR